MLKNVGSNWFLLLVTILATYFLVPFNLRYLGEEQYGIWLLIGSMTSYLGLLQLGVPMASVRQLAQAIAKGDTVELNRLVASCAGLYLGLGAVLGIIGVPLLYFLEHFYPIPHALQSQVRYAFLLALLNAGLGLISQLPLAILNAYQDFVRKNMLSSLLVVVRAGLNVLVVAYYPSLLILAALQVLMTIAEMVLVWIVIRMVHKDVRLHLTLFSKDAVRQIVGFSIYVMIFAMGARLSFQTDAMVIGAYLGAKAIPTFSVGNNILIYLMQFVVGIASVIMPMATTLQAKGKMDELRRVFFKWSKISIAMTWLAGLYVIVFGPEFLGNWVGAKFEEPSGRVLRILMVSYMMFLPVRGVAMPILMGLGHAKRPALAVLAAGIVNVILSVVLVKPLGLDGVAWGTAIPNAVLAVVLLVLVGEVLGVTVRSFVRATLPRALAGGAVVLASLWWLRTVWKPRTFIELAVAGIATVALFGLAWVGFVLRRDPDVSLPRVPLLARLFSPTKS